MGCIKKLPDFSKQISVFIIYNTSPFFVLKILERKVIDLKILEI